MRIVSRVILTAAGLSVLAVGWRAGEAPLFVTGAQAVTVPPIASSALPSSASPPSAAPAGSDSPPALASSAVPSATPTQTAEVPAPPSGTFTGPAINSPYGAIQMQLVVKNGKITVINTLQNGRRDSETQSINARAIPKLVSEVLSAQTYKVSYVSGASYTSPGLLSSVQGAMADAGLG
jgi:uncharacterized protein with FMN-binding domain